MKLKILNSYDSRIKRTFDGFNQRCWQLRSASNNYRDGVGCIDNYSEFLYIDSSKKFHLQSSCMFDLMNVLLNF